MTLGSLFDGIGGFPLSGVMHGIRPVWAAEIEPFPVLVTSQRFPEMKHLGSVTDIGGAEIEPVDIVTFGSPCQDLSVAGLQKGIHEGARSSLFFEAVRIIKEMRAHERSTGRSGKHVRPRFAVWENVPGAFSSNKGRDFQAVLQALCEVADTDVSVPFPEKGQWSKAGCIVGDGYSIAWRTYDAQYWGVHQRRKRIYLVADFAGERAGEILFEQDGVRGNPAQSGEERQGAAEDAEGSAGRSGGAVLTGFDAYQHHGWRQSETLETVTTAGASIRGDTPLVVKTYGIGSYHSNSWKSDNPRSGVYEAETSRTPDLNGGNPSCNQGGIAVVYDCRGNGAGGVTPTLTGDHQNRVTDYTALAVCAGNGQLHNATMKPVANALDCMHDQQAVVTDGKPLRRYIVRRLTPLECCRLQGYPDGWTENLAIENPTDEQVNFFMEVWERWAKINGVKPKSRAQVIKWLGDPQSDSAEYKAYGNSLAIPCSSDVLGRIARAMEEEEDGHQTD